MTDRMPLDPGEHVIWSGRPNAFRYALAKGWLLGLVGMLMAVIDGGRLLRYSATGDRRGAVLATVFACFWLVAAVSPLWHFFRGLRTRYAITSKRLIIQSTWRKALRLSTPLNRVAVTGLRRRFGTLADILFECTPGPYVWREHFYAISDAVQVERILRDAIEKAKR